MSWDHRFPLLKQLVMQTITIKPYLCSNHVNSHMMSWIFRPRERVVLPVWNSVRHDVCEQAGIRRGDYDHQQ